MKLKTKKFHALLIAGPTAGGKSPLALSLAQKTNALIINADSMQIYCDLSVLTARPSPDDLMRAEHRLYGHVDGAVNYSVGAWLRESAILLEHLRQDGRPAIFVGGTGLYFKALTQGLSIMPHIPEEIRLAIRGAAAGKSPQTLHAELSACDPETAARLHPTDPQRILRALEIFAATGKSLATYQTERAPPLLPAASWSGFFLDPGRECARAAIDARFRTMVAAGALEEAERLMARNLDHTLPIMRAHGAPHLMAHLRGHMSLEEACQRGQSDTRAYAKRQYTFARHQLADFVWGQAEEIKHSALTRLMRHS